MVSLFLNPAFLWMITVLASMATWFLLLETIKYKNFSNIFLFLFPIAPIAILVFIFIPYKKGKNNLEKQDIFLNQVFFKSLFKFEKSNWEIVNYFEKKMRRKNLDVEYALSYIKIALENKKNTAWTSITFSLLISFIISFSISSLNSIQADRREEVKNLIEKGISTSSTIQLSYFGYSPVLDFSEFLTGTIFSMILCIGFFVFTLSYVNKINYLRLLQLNEVLLLYKQNQEKLNV